jgi:hypothetical protein
MESFFLFLCKSNQSQAGTPDEWNPSFCLYANPIKVRQAHQILNADGKRGT